MSQNHPETFGWRFRLRTPSIASYGVQVESNFAVVEEKIYSHSVHSCPFHMRVKAALDSGLQNWCMTMQKSAVLLSLKMSQVFFPPLLFQTIPTRNRQVIRGLALHFSHSFGLIGIYSFLSAIIKPFGRVGGPLNFLSKGCRNSLGRRCLGLEVSMQGELRGFQLTR